MDDDEVLARHGRRGQSSWKFCAQRGLQLIVVVINPYHARCTEKHYSVSISHQRRL